MPGGETAVGDEADAGGAGLRVEREFGVDDGVVAAEVAEVGARLDGRAREPQVVEVGHATERGVVRAHQADDRGRVLHVERDGADAAAPDRLGDGPRPTLVHVGHRHQPDALRVVRQVVGRAQAHAARTEDEKVHKRSGQ